MTKGWCRVLLQKLLGLGLLLAAGPALACQYEFAPEPVGGPSAKFLASKMGPAATFIDLAVAEGASEVAGPVGKTSSKAISFRVIDRWKGQSPDRFLLFGGLASAKDPGWAVSHWVDDQGRVEPYESVREASIRQPEAVSSCDPPTLMAKTGETYVILREADGRLLGAVEFHPEAQARRGTAIAAATNWPNDEWARQLSYIRDARNAPPAIAPIDQSRAMVRFRRPLDQAATARLLATAKATPFGAYIARDGIISDYRLGSDIAFPGLIPDAARWAAAQSTGRELVAAHAKAIVGAVAARDLANDGAWLSYARSVLAVADSATQTGEVGFVAVDVVADAAAQRALAGEPDVAEVIPARTVRGRVSSAPVRPTARPVPDIGAVEAYRRLVRLAGKDLANSAIVGRWRMTGADALAFGEKIFTLELRDGRAAAVMPCARSEGTYRFAGGVLELALPKPELSACPKTQDYWYPAFLFDTDGVMTIKPAPNAVSMVANSGTFHFRREAM